jgi:superfamily II DNA or RNA helicase
VTPSLPPRQDTIGRLARAALRARALLFDTPATQLGDVTLLPHQESAARWLLARINRHGGALLADPPGLGKTFVALAVAARRNTRPLVIAPAVLRTHWLHAATRAATPIDFVSTECLSAPAVPRVTRHAFVIIDEAHHLRTPGTRRHQRTATLCHNADVLLLSATPIHNARTDLAHVIRLFHLPPNTPSTRLLRHRLTLRRTLDAVHAAAPPGTDRVHVPIVRTRKDLAVRSRATQMPASIMAAVLALPPLRPGHRDDAHTLVQLGLLHALRSSNAAARQRLRHRIAITIAIEHAANAGVLATPLLRRAFEPLDSDVQLAMATLLGEPCTQADPQLAAAAQEHRRALERMLGMLSDTGDRERARALRRLSRWSRGPIVAFTWSTATANAICHYLRNEPGVALLTGTHARIASGSIPREELLQRLLPTARIDGAGARAHHRVRVLVTTDVLSEGLSLSGVRMVVHLDLPWTHARLDQRTGRAARIGAPVSEIHVTRLLSPLPTEVHAGMATLLARKRRAMRIVHRDDELDPSVISLLVTLARVDDARTHPLATGRWITLRHAQITAPLILAIVQLAGRRQLVALGPDKRLRRPAPNDWRVLGDAIACVGPTRMRAQLRAALLRHQADTETTEQVTHLQDRRLQARFADDEALLRHTSIGRATASGEASAHRRDLMAITRPGQLATSATLSAAECAGRSALSALDVDVVSAGCGHAPPRARFARDVRIICGAAIVPAVHTSPSAKRVTPA